MRTFAIGDIHGCLAPLKKLIKKLDLQPDDTLITLGDYVDRGPDSRGVIEYLIKLGKKCNLITLKGNHEELMELAFTSDLDMLQWFNVGGYTTLQSYIKKGHDIIPDKHWEFIENCELYYETDTHIFVHGGIKPELDLDEQDVNDLLWMRIADLKAHKSGKTIICGHTPQRDHNILKMDHAICIDTHAFAKGKLTCIEVGTNEVWQVKSN